MAMSSLLRAVFHIASRHCKKIAGSSSSERRLFATPDSACLGIWASTVSWAICYGLTGIRTTNAEFSESAQSERPDNDLRCRLTILVGVANKDERILAERVNVTCRR